MSDGHQQASPQSELLQLRRTVKRLETQSEDLERRLERQHERMDVVLERLPQTAVLSSRFLERAFGVWGHCVVVQLILGAVIVALSCLLALLGYSYGG